MDVNDWLIQGCTWLNGKLIEGWPDDSRNIPAINRSFVSFIPPGRYHSFIHSATHSLTHSFIRSFFRSFIHSFVRSLIN